MIAENVTVFKAEPVSDPAWDCGLRFTTRDQDTERSMNYKTTIGIGILMSAAGMASASGVGDIMGFNEQARLFNDFAGSTLSFSSSYSASGSSVSLQESDYGSGNFANRHTAWFADGSSNNVDFDYGDGWDMQMTMQINDATGVGNIEAGFQTDLFGFGLFGVLSSNGEIAAFGSVLPFHSFGTGLYSVGDVLMLRMIHMPGDGEFGSTPSTMEYMYNNMTTGSGWVSSGAIDFTTTEGGIPSSFNMFTGVGAQINQPASDASVDISFTNITVPAPGALGLFALSGLCASRRRR